MHAKLHHIRRKLLPASHIIPFSDPIHDAYRGVPIEDNMVISKCLKRKMQCGPTLGCVRLTRWIHLSESVFSTADLKVSTALGVEQLFSSIVFPLSAALLTKD